MRDHFLTLAKIVLSIGLVAWALSRVDLAYLGHELAGARPGYVLLALLLFVAAIVVNGVKWYVLVRVQRLRVPAAIVIEYEYLSFFFNIFLPNVGGDIARGYRLARYTGQTAPAAVSVAVDLLVGLTAHVATAAVAGLVGTYLTGNAELRTVETIAILAALGLAIVLTLALSSTNRRLVTRILEWRPLRRLSPAWKLLSEALEAYRMQPRTLALAFGIALLGIVCTTLVNWCVSQSMGGHLRLREIFLFNPLITLALMLPVSVGSGIGISQNVYPFFYGMAGAPEGHALAVSVLVQAVVIAGSLPGGWSWMRARRNVCELAAEQVQ